MGMSALSHMKTYPFNKISQWSGHESTVVLGVGKVEWIWGYNNYGGVGMGLCGVGMGL